MNQEVPPQVARRYLDELDAALVGVPADVARDILDGIQEELSALDPAAAATRIEELGDPMFIAAAARAESIAQPSASASDGVGTSASSRTGSRGYVVFVSLLVAFGGLVIPILGWIVGLVLMWLSKQWRTWEKWVATAAVPAIAFLIGVIGIAGLGLAFSGFAGWHLLILLGVFGTVVVGLWLLWRGLRRPAPDPRPAPAAAEGGTAASGDAQWYIVLASLLVAFGGIVVPLLGWVFGMAMVWVSKTWRTWEKSTATLTAPLVTALAVVIARLVAGDLGGSGSVNVGEVPNPLLPVWYDAWWSILVQVIALNVLVGIWLLWRGLRRSR